MDDETCKWSRKLISIDWKKRRGLKPKYAQNWFFHFLQNMLILGHRHIFQCVYWTKKIFFWKKNMSSRRFEHGEQNCVIRIFLKRSVKIGKCVRITFRTTPKIAGKTHFFIFWKFPNALKMISNPKNIMIFRPLGNVSTIWQNLSRIREGVPPP